MVGVVEYAYVQAALWLQLWVWVALYNRPLGERVEQVLRVGFYVATAAAMGYITLFQPKIGFFNSWLLLQYTVYVLISVSLLVDRFGFRQALCLGFLTVFLNSFYWEFFYHVHEFQIWFPASLGLGWWFLRVPQWVRVLPAYFLNRWLRVCTLRWVMLGLAVSYVLTYARFVLRWPSTYLHPVHRTICLSVLLYTLHCSSEREKN